MTTWRVLKRDAILANTWEEIGSHESDASYWLGPDAAQRIGEKFGAGEYLLFSEDNRANSLRVAERSEFYEIDDEDNMPVKTHLVSAPDGTLKAAPSAAEIMDREG